MRPGEAASEVARDFGVEVEEPILLQDTNNNVFWLAPSPVVAKVGAGQRNWLEKELIIGMALEAASAPVVGPSRLVPRAVHQRQGYRITFWRYVSQTGGDLPAPSVASEHARAVAMALRDGGFAGTLLLEPGRALVADTVALAFTVVAVKQLADGTRCLICDAGTNLLPGALTATPAIEAPESAGPHSRAMVTGPLCLNIDVLHPGAILPPITIRRSLMMLLSRSGLRATERARPSPQPGCGGASPRDP